MENSFAAFYTVFDLNKEPDILNLSKVYDDAECLKYNIKSLLNGYIDDLDIENKKILLKPNWVVQDRTETDKICLRTHDNFVLAVLELILEMKPASIVLGDAPIQGCLWEKMISQQYIEKVAMLSKQHNIPVTIKDLRRVNFNITIGSLIEDKKSLDDFIIFDLANKSFLEPITKDNTEFRVTNYNPERLGESHRKGVHKYCISKEIFEADVIFTIPKIKTHQKTGLTNSLKILVGINGDKDFLPHHRKGGTDDGGDCYPGKNKLRKMSENLYDSANKKRGTKVYNNLIRMASITWKASNPDSVQNPEAGWYGNDTTWRMVLDINKIALYGKSNAEISDVKQRVIYSICDGIIAGQGDGPLNPSPLALGLISFSNDAALMDVLVGKLIGIDVDYVPLLKNAMNYIDMEQSEIKLNNKLVTEAELLKLAVKAQLPLGWVDYKIAE